MSTDDVRGIDFPSLDGFTIRELLIEAAGVASGEEAPAIKATAFEMLDLFKKPGTPSLSSKQVEAYVDMVSLARDYEGGVTMGEPDEYAPEDERRTYAMLTHTADLMHAVRWLGSY